MQNCHPPLGSGEPCSSIFCAVLLLLALTRRYTLFWDGDSFTASVRTRPFNICNEIASDFLLIEEARRSSPCGRDPPHQYTRSGPALLAVSRVLDRLPAPHRICFGCERDDHALQIAVPLRSYPRRTPYARPPVFFPAPHPISSSSCDKLGPPWILVLANASAPTGQSGYLAHGSHFTLGV
ncbi:hypothetical protein B0H12DRAFT_767010 [Mycena haematopus]|nr:hypothetical protein B0H12DRAFT_767010 [Mycena haematopus]